MEGDLWATVKETKAERMMVMKTALLCAPRPDLCAPRSELTSTSSALGATERWNGSSHTLWQALALLSVITPNSCQKMEVDELTE